MNRTEALRILGLDEDASEEDIRIAYKETAQILHPDRFASNKKLQDRATEQFKNLQEAYECLKNPRKTRGSKNAGGAGVSSGTTYASKLEARIAGIEAARTYLVCQRDALSDERRNALIFIGLGVIGVIFGRKPGPLATLAAAGGAAFIWGLVKLVSTQRSMNTLEEDIDKLRKEQRELTEELESL